MPCLCSLCVVFLFFSTHMERERAVSGERIISALSSRILDPVGSQFSGASPTLQFTQSCPQRGKIRRGYFLLFCASITLQMYCLLLFYKMEAPPFINFLNSFCVYINVCIHAHINLLMFLCVCLYVDVVCGFSIIQKVFDDFPLNTSPYETHPNTRRLAYILV